MNTELAVAWLALLLLGMFHGINPGMGWLFAVALGLQEKKRSAVWKSLIPLAAGHALAVGVAVFLAAMLGLVIPLGVLKWGVAAVLVAFGFFHLVRHRHPRFGGMQVGARDLTIWSFLMASAHGAGLMVLPFIFGAGLMSSPGESHHPVASTVDHHVHHEVIDHVHGTESAPPIEQGHAHADHAASLLAGLPPNPIIGLLATLVHTIGYLLVIGIIAVVVYEKLGLRWLRGAWVNLDLIWAGALIVTAVVTLLI